MQEIAPGIHHWTARHPVIRTRVHSAYVEPARALIDPLLPEEGLAAFEGLARPEVVLLTNRHHYRHSDRFSEAFGCVVRASAAGMHEFEGTERRVEPFAPRPIPAFRPADTETQDILQEQGGEG